MTSPLARSLVTAAVGAVALYLVFQWFRYGFDSRYLSYTSPDLETARSENLLIGEYQAVSASDQFAHFPAYVVRPTTKNLGYMLIGTRIVVPDAVTVSIDVDSIPRGLRLEFEDGAGVRMSSDGGTKPILPIEAPGTEAYGPDISGCCSSNRSRVPERFWITLDGERVCEFRLNEATRHDVLPQTRWTW